MAAIHHAIILAAGAGTRLRRVADNRPKGLIEIEGEALVARSVRLLRAAGVERITIVTGYSADYYERFAAGQAGLELVNNDKFATTGSMASLALALDRTREDALVLESDIVFEARALTTILGAAAADAMVISGPTSAGDEVWVHAPSGTLDTMTKVRRDLPAVSGEFVGITRVSVPAADAMLQVFDEFVDANGHGRMNYETDALVAIAAARPITALRIDDLCWGEIDDERQYDRVVKEVWPAVGSHPPHVAT